jgi:hypothetical protein
VDPHATEAVEFDAATRRLHRRLSATAERFLDYVERHPEAAERSSYEVLDRDKRGVVTRLQSWPLFIDRRQQTRCSEAMLSLAAVVRTAPHRVFGDDAERLAAWYDLEIGTARVMTRLLADPKHLSSIVARGDFVETENGFGCVEINVAGNLGGWTIGLWERHYLKAPPVRDFVRRQGVDLVGVDPMGAFFAHVRGVAAAAGLNREDEVNVALAVPPQNTGTGALMSVGAEGYRAYLDACGGGRGEFLACSYDDLEIVDGRRVLLDGRRIHVLVEAYSGIVPHRLFEPWMAGGLALLNGPVGQVLNDRRTLALVSEHAESALFSATEREVVHRHLPWTRVVADEEVTYRGRRVRLPDVLAQERPAMVLKRTASLGGEKVVIGATTEPHTWSDRVAEAVAEGKWIAQERLLSLPYAFQHGPTGWLPHEVVWGIFSFGDRYGGGFLRVLPQGGSGIVNASRGADDGIFLVVDEL